MKPLKNLSELNSNTKEGRYLLAALSKITTESQTDKTPDEVLAQLYDLQEYMFKDATDIPDDAPQRRPPFIKALEELINSYSMENKSNTPDFILAEHMMASLTNFEQSVNERSRWYGQEPTKTQFHESGNQGIIDTVINA